MMAWKRRTAKWTACSAAPPPIFLSPPATSPPSKSWPWSATISRRRITICSPPAISGSDGLERVPGGKTFFWAGVYSADMNDRTTLRTDLNVFAGFDPKLPESYLRLALPAARQYPAGAAAQRPHPDARRPPHRRRHHELLDQRLPRRAARNPPPVGLPADQRQRSAPAFGRAQPAPRRRQDHGDGPAHPGDQARRVRRHPVPPRLPLLRSRLSARRRLRSHRRRRLLRRRLHRLPGRPRCSAVATAIWIWTSCAAP